MKRIMDFGSFMVNQQLDILESKLKKGDILLFQYYEKNSEYFDKQDCINEYFENYWNDIIYYYNPDLQLEIYNEVLQELLKNIEQLEEKDEKRKMERAKKLFYRMKAGEYTDIFEKTLQNIKRLVFDKLVNRNIDSHEYDYVIERMYGKSQWILDERGIIPDKDGAIWYKPINRNEYYNVLESFPIFSCMILKNGKKVDEFSFGYVVEKTADNYDLLIFENK